MSKVLVGLAVILAIPALAGEKRYRAVNGKVSSSRAGSGGQSSGSSGASRQSSFSSGPSFSSPGSSSFATGISAGSFSNGIQGFRGGTTKRSARGVRPSGMGDMVYRSTGSASGSGGGGGSNGPVLSGGGVSTSDTSPTSVPGGSGGTGQTDPPTGGGPTSTSIPTTRPPIRTGPSGPAAPTSAAADTN